MIDAFIAKLSSKGQSEGLCVQARKAVSLYLGLNEAESALSKASASNIKVHAPPESDGAAQAARQNRMPTPESKPQAIEGNWAATIRAMESAISRRNYSKKTLSTYVMWVKRFGEYADHMPVAEITDEVAKGFLTDLAVKNDGVASTQNQAFNALLFLFRLVLKRDFALRPRRFVAGSLSARRVRSIAAADPVTTGSGEE